MKLGVILSVVLVLALGAIIFLSTQGVADQPTSATRAEKLQKAVLDPSLPRMVDAGSPDLDAARAYDKVFALYADNTKVYDKRDVPQSMADKMTGLLIDAMAAGKVEAPFIDEYVPMDLTKRPEFGDALEAINDVVGTRITALTERGDAPYAIKASLALWAMGQRMVERCVRMHNRRAGLIMMKTAGEKLFALADKADDRPTLKDDLTKWAAALNRIEVAWNEKIQMIWKPKHDSVADLARIAKDDQDPTFRVEAMLYLGVAKFNPRSNANKRMMLATIEAGKSDAHPMIVQAAQAADALTREQMLALK